MKRIILSGANGAMGHEIAACINNRDDCKIVAGLDINTNVYSDFPIYNNADELTCGADVIIDFSHVSVLTPLWHTQPRNAFLWYSVQQDIQNLK